MKVGDRRIPFLCILIDFVVEYYQMQYTASMRKFMKTCNFGITYTFCVLYVNN